MKVAKVNKDEATTLKPKKSQIKVQNSPRKLSKGRKKVAVEVVSNSPVKQSAIEENLGKIQATCSNGHRSRSGLAIETEMTYVDEDQIVHMTVDPRDESFYQSEASDEEDPEVQIMNRSSLNEENFEPHYEGAEEEFSDSEGNNQQPQFTHAEKIQALDLEMQEKICELQQLMDQGGLAGAEC